MLRLYCMARQAESQRRVSSGGVLQSPGKPEPQLYSPAVAVSQFAAEKFHCEETGGCLLHQLDT